MGVAGVMPRVVEAFRTGGRVPFEDYARHAIRDCGRKPGAVHQPARHQVAAGDP
jgi:hypothetical protein